jgi:hypothetical protein
MDYACRKAAGMDGFMDDLKDFLGDVKGVGQQVQQVQQVFSPTAAIDKTQQAVNSIIKPAPAVNYSAIRSTGMSDQTKKYLMYGGLGLAGILLALVIVKAVK